jgi:hypothetical protein
MFKPTATVSENLRLCNRPRLPRRIQNSDVDVPVLRRPYRASKDHSAGVWVYFIRVSPVSLIGLRIRESDAEESPHKYRWLGLVREITFNVRSKKSREELCRAFDELVQKVIHRAQIHEKQDKAALARVKRRPC